MARLVAVSNGVGPLPPGARARSVRRQPMSARGKHKASAAAREVSGRPKRCKMAHAFLWGHSYKRLQSVQLLGQLGVFLTAGPMCLSLVGHMGAVWLLKAKGQVGYSRGSRSARVDEPHEVRAARHPTGRRVCGRVLQAGGRGQFAPRGESYDADLWTRHTPGYQKKIVNCSKFR